MRCVKDILQEKGTQVYAISPDATVYEALQLMADKNVGALMVMEGDTAVGLISERDYARKIVLKGRFSKDVPVREIMTADVIRVGPDDDVEYCMELMTDKRVRHLPVFKNDQLIGIISIGDIVNTIIKHKEEIIEQLENYIKGKR
ncbi:MAG: CBS domain-containing protein [Desulfobacterales bacterium]|jgi:CBS domain-containing protein|nr:CBS domain-containing protein [Desulfobacterales bacterium]